MAAWFKDKHIIVTVVRSGMQIPLFFDEPENHCQSLLLSQGGRRLIGSDGQPKTSHRQTQSALWGLYGVSSLTVKVGLDLWASFGPVVRG